MIRLGIIGEGVSEQTVARDIIAPHLLSYGITVFSRLIVTKRKASQMLSKGGMPRYSRVRDDILHLVKEDSGRIITSMFDFYALPSDFPGFSEIEKISNPYEKVKLLETYFSRDINSERFVPYIQLYEFEALFFADAKIVHEVLSLNGSTNCLKDLEKNPSRNF